MIIGAIPASTIRREARLGAEHYLFSAERHARRIAAAREAIRVAIKRYRNAQRRCAADLARCQRLGTVSS